MNRLLGHKLGFTWQGNLLIPEQNSRRLADATELVVTAQRPDAVLQITRCE